ncbi:unnamed protein product [Brachionus calyciflorus]|uniref:3-beta hydroxysteroid dehydrogenase/isomerase domain-containing protein n=1 Tax=Brachionus calyciflorus TaxID=104777 RepID=A0A813ZS16_9BILA|nr:unnamed protein product [Brachionus calyciflorus]
MEALNENETLDEQDNKEEEVSNVNENKEQNPIELSNELGDQNQESEINEAESFISDSSNLRNQKKSIDLNAEEIKRAEEDMEHVIAYQNSPKNSRLSLVSSQTESKNIEILDLKERDLDEIDRPFTFSQPGNVKSTLIELDSGRKSPAKKESFLPELQPKTKAPNKSTRSIIFTEPTKSKPMENSKNKSSFRAMNEDDLQRTFDRLSAVPKSRFDEPRNRTIHDKVKDIDLSAVSLRLYSSNIHGKFRYNKIYEDYFIKKIRQADPIVVIERLSAKKDTKVPDSCRTIKSSPMKKNDLCVSWAWKLSKTAHRIRATVRNVNDKTKVDIIKRASDKSKYPIQLVSADLTNADSWIEACRGVDIVIHTASPFPVEDPKDPENQLYKPAIQGTKNVLNAAFNANVRRVVLTSSCVSLYDFFATNTVFTEKDCFKLTTQFESSPNPNNPNNRSDTTRMTKVLGIKPTSFENSIIYMAESLIKAGVVKK